MFVKAVPDNKNGKDGYFCSLVRSVRRDGKPVHEQLLSFGFLPSGRLPYLRAAFNDGDPEGILAREKAKQEGKRNGR